MSKDSILKKIRAWMENEAIRDEQSIKTLDKFPSLKEARIADAKNYRAMIKDINDALDDNEAIAANNAEWVGILEEQYRKCNMGECLHEEPECQFMRTDELGEYHCRWWKDHKRR